MIEDTNDNGILEGTEDINGNERLDGGTTQNKVIASIQRNRLFLTSTIGGSRKIDLRDPDNILLILGFFDEGTNGLPVEKVSEVDFSKEPAEELIKLPQNALLEVDGTKFANPTNVFKNALDGTELKTKRETSLDTEIKISTNTGKAVNLIQKFFEEFNRSVRQINQALAETRVFERDPEFQNIRRDLLNITQSRIQNLNQKSFRRNDFLARRQNNSILGISVENSEKRVVQEISVSSAVQRIKDRLMFFDNSLGPESLRRLTSIGIKTNEDDTIKVNSVELEMALRVNNQTVLDIFNNEENGLLPQLANELDSILNDGFGDLAIKRDQVLLESGIPDPISKGFEQTAINKAREELNPILENALLEFRGKAFTGLA